MLRSVESQCCAEVSPSATLCRALVLRSIESQCYAQVRSNAPFRGGEGGGDYLERSTHPLIGGSLGCI